MTRDNLYWLSHDQVALFKTFRSTASRCKQTINHAVPKIKQPSFCYTISYCTCHGKKGRERRSELRRQNLWREKDNEGE
ncbi:hypothetical protein Lal_00042607 [Lupinus albus]|nr:hypothetical protein Lal_00042607 [Lupinus albus]